MSERSRDCGCLYPLIPCIFASSPEDIINKRRSNEIDRQLRKDKQEYRNTIRLLLLGAGESGKSTIIKQMQIIHVEKFSERIKQEKRHDIRENLREAIICIVQAMTNVSPAESLENAENATRVRWLMQNAQRDDFHFPQEFYDHVYALWKDKGVQATYYRSSEYQLIDNAQYFLERIDEIRKDNYLPTEQDILRCRVLTKGIHTIKFHIKNVLFHIVDVGGQRGERRKWFLCFNEVTAIIFVAATSSFDMVLREDQTKNRLRESLDIFKVVWNNRFLRHISVILFLNKQDIFKHKILTKRIQIQDYFEEFQYYELPQKVKKEEINEHPDVVKGKYFIRSLFENICADSNVFTNRYHRSYFHFTCAVDTENIKRVFDDCRDSIQIRYLHDTDLL